MAKPERGADIKFWKAVYRLWDAVEGARSPGDRESPPCLNRTPGAFAPLVLEVIHAYARWSGTDPRLSWAGWMRRAAATILAAFVGGLIAGVSLARSGL